MDVLEGIATELAREGVTATRTLDANVDRRIAVSLAVAEAELNLGMALSKRRSALHLSRREVSERTHLALKTIYSTEHGTYSATLETLLRLSDALGCVIVLEPGFGVRLTVVGK